MRVGAEKRVLNGPWFLVAGGSVEVWLTRERIETSGFEVLEEVENVHDGFAGSICEFLVKVYFHRNLVDAAQSA